MSDLRYMVSEKLVVCQIKLIVTAGVFSCFHCKYWYIIYYAERVLEHITDSKVYREQTQKVYFNKGLWKRQNNQP